MRTIVLLLFSVALFVQADVIYQYPFDELDAQWNLGTGWENTPAGPCFQQNLWGKCCKAQDAVYQSTVFLDFPQGCDSVTLELNTGFHHTGYTMDAGVDVSMVIQLDPFTSDVVLYNESDSHSSWDYHSFDISDSTSADGTVSLTPDHQGRIIFRATMSGYGDIWETNLQWDIWDMFITAHGVVPIERNTWASIKGLF